MAFTDEQINEINRKLKEKGIKDSQFAQAHSLTGGEKVPILQDAENRLMDVLQLQTEITDIPEFKSEDESLRVNQQLRSVDLRAKCYVSNEESGWAEASLFFEDENCSTDTGSCKNFQRFILNDKNGRIIKVDVIAKQTIQSPTDITIKASGDIEDTDLFELSLGTTDSDGYYGEIKFKSKYANTSLPEDMLFLQAVSDKSNTYPKVENFTPLFTIEGGLKTYETVSRGGLTGRTAKASLINIEDVLEGLMQYAKFGMYNNYHDIYEWLNYSDEMYEEMSNNLPPGGISFINKFIGYHIDTLKNGIDLDEITPKILTESDDYNFGMFAFLQAYCWYNNINPDPRDPVSFEQQSITQNLKKSTSSKSNTKIASESDQPPLWEHNTVFIEHNNDVMKCIDDNLEMFLDFMYYVQDSNVDGFDYVFKHQQEPVGINPYHKFSGTYLSQDYWIFLNGGSGGGANPKKTSVNTKSTSNTTRSTAKETSKKMTYEEYKSKLAEFYGFKKKETPTTKSAPVNSRVLNPDDSESEDSDIPEFPYEVKTDINALNDIMILPTQGTQTINIKKYMIAFYKLMKVFSIMSNPDEVAREVLNRLDQVGISGLSSFYNFLVMLAISGQRNDDALDDYLDELLDELCELSGGYVPSNLNNAYSLYGRLIILSMSDRDKYQAFMKEVYDAIYDFDILLGNGQNMPYEDTNSFFIKIKDTWYELIIPYECVYSEFDEYLDWRNSIFEPNREYKLVHLGDWKHCGDNNPVAVGLTDDLADVGATMDVPIDARDMIYDALLGPNDDNPRDDNPGEGN